MLTGLPSPRGSFVQILLFFCLFKSSVSEQNYLILSEDGKTVTKILPSHRGPVVIPEGVEVIDKSVFAFNVVITSVKFPSSLKQIGERSFEGCSKLTGSLVIPEGVTSIGSHAFQLCTGFTGQLTIPNSVTSIGDGVFIGCSGFTGSLSLSESLISIGTYAFYQCRGFTGSLTIPNSVTVIGNMAFYQCGGFNGLLSISESLISLGYQAFQNCSGLTGPLVIPASVTSIGNSAFYNCTGFTGSLTILSSQTDLGSGAFTSCSGLTSVHFKGPLRLIPYYTFLGCTSLEFCSFESKDVNIATDAFLNTPKLALFFEQNQCTDFKYNNLPFQGSKLSAQVKCIPPIDVSTNKFTNGAFRAHTSIISNLLLLFVVAHQ